MNAEAATSFKNETALEASARRDLLDQLLFISCPDPDNSALHLESLRFILDIGKYHIDHTVEQVVRRHISELTRKIRACSHETASAKPLKYVNTRAIRRRVGEKKGPDLFQQWF